jgi:aryl-alcohol dehydrogenase-like predicted oxidoreductase
MAKTLDLTVTPWDTLGSGVLTGKYNRDATAGGRAAQWGRVSERDLGIAAEVIKVAEEIGRTPAQVALAWVRGGPGVIVPLVGAKTRAQLDDNLGCLDLELAPEQRARLDEVSRIELGFPHDFLAQQMGGVARSLEDHRAR